MLGLMVMTITRTMVVGDLIPSRDRERKGNIEERGDKRGRDNGLIKKLRRRGSRDA